MFLRRLARRTWRFFETFVAEEDSHLPPDNFQEHPPVGIAHRTSPTNVGLALLANVAAWDFGYVPARRVADRCRATMDTMARLERLDGHFYNWYDTRTLEPLPPAYVSTVDSGNLSGSLLVLRSGLLELIDAPALAPQTFDGLRDTLGLMLEAAAGDMELAGDPEDDAPVKTTPLTPPGEWVERTRDVLRGLDRPADLHAAAAKLDELAEVAAEADDLLVKHEGQRETEAGYWAGQLVAQVEEARATLGGLAPWAGTGTRPDKLPGWPALSAVAGADFDGIDDPKLRAACAEAKAAAGELVADLRELAAEAGKLAEADYRGPDLYDPARKLLRIGYNAQDRRPDQSFYDLLASEARLASYYAIAAGQLPTDHWFALGRNLTVGAGGEAALLSWSGSMFEYLMPLLVMPSYPGTLLDQTYRGVVRRQIAYGKQRNVPWGISESGYHTTDAQKNYQYRPVRRAGAGAQARAVAGPRGRALRDGDGADGRRARRRRRT